MTLETKTGGDDAVETSKKACKDGIAPQNPASRSSELQGIPSKIEPNDNKLYSRSQEIALLLQSYQNAAPMSNFTLISGSSGTGKTRLALALKPQVESTNGYFLVGKFDQLRTEHYRGFVAAIDDFVDQVVAKGNEAVVKNHILSHMGEKAAGLLTCRIPSLTRILGPSQSSSSAVLQPSEAPDRFRSVFQQFLVAAMSPREPIVFLLDDLQWADPDSLELLTALILESEIFVLGTTRDSVAPASVLSTTLRKLEHEGVQITNIALSNLDLTAIQDMVDDRFHLQKEESALLSQILVQRTNGNAYFIVELLRTLQDQGVLSFDHVDKEWELDTISLQSEACYSCKTVSDLLVRRVEELPQHVLELIKVASCLGASIDHALLRCVAPIQYKDLLDIAVNRGVLFRSRDSYSFVHDGVQSVVYGLIPEQDRDSFHLAVGRRIWRALDSSELDFYLLAVLNQVQQGAHLITNQKERYAVAALAFRCIEKSSQWSFRVASVCADLAFEMLGENHWQEEYELSLALYNAAAELQFCLANFDRVDHFLESVFVNARCFSDTVRAYSTQVYILGAQNDMDRAVDKGLYVLKSLGVPLRAKHPVLGTMLDMLKVKRMLIGRSDENLKRIPPMDDPNRVAAMQMLNLLFASTAFSRPCVFPLVILKMMMLTLNHGLSAISAAAFAGYGVLLCSFGDYCEGYRFGRIALDVLDIYDGARAFRPRVYAVVWGMIHQWLYPLSETLEPLLEGYQLGLETGDVEFAMFNANLYCFNFLDGGQGRLDTLERRASDMCDTMIAYKQYSQLLLMKPFLERIRKFTTPSKDPLQLSDETKQTLEQARKTDNYVASSNIYLGQLVLAFFLGNDEAAGDMAESFQYWMEKSGGSAQASVFHFFDGLACYAMVRLGKKTRKHLARASRRRRTLKKRSMMSPQENTNKFNILKAEQASVSGDHVLAQKLYEDAIALAAENKCLQELAISNLLAGRHYRGLNKTEAAIRYLTDARAAFESWGALTIVKYLACELDSLQPSVRRNFPKETSC